MRAGLGLLAVLAAGCSPVLRAGADVEPGVPFTHYQGVVFDETRRSPSGDPRVDRSVLFERRLHQAIQWELEIRGIEADGDGPQLLAHHHVSVRDVVEFRDEHDEAGLSWAGDVKDEELIEYREATFVVGLADATTRQIVWRGWASLPAGGELDDPEWMRTRIDEAVARMFDAFPLDPRSVRSSPGGPLQAVPDTTSPRQ